MGDKMEKQKNKLFISSIMMIVFLLYDLTKNINEYLNNKFELVIFIVLVIFSGYFMYLTSKKVDLKKHRVPVLIISIVFFLINIISGVFGFLVCKDLREKKELPVLEDVKDYNKYICLIGLIISLVLLFYVPDLIGEKYRYFLYLIIFLLMTFIYRKRLFRDFKVFIKNFTAYNSFVLKLWGISLLITIVLSLIISFISHMPNATNQTNLNEMFKKMPFYVAFLCMIYAPISEELMFRATFKKLFKNKYLFIIISGVLFRIAHVIDDYKTYYELLYILVYSSLGIFLSYIYYKTNNIFASMYFHFLQNTLSIIAMIFMFFVK